VAPGACHADRRRRADARPADLPKPFVYQRGLADWYVEYELFAHMDKPLERVPVLSALHANIQDQFNTYGVQIMSPHFVMQPGNNVVVPREHWHAPPAAPEGSATGLTPGNGAPTGLPSAIAWPLITAFPRNSRIVGTSTEPFPVFPRKSSMISFAVTVFLSAFLLFQIQPIIAKMILPWFGGSSSVWSTCLVFFQANSCSAISMFTCCTSGSRPAARTWSIACCCCVESGDPAGGCRSGMEGGGIRAPDLERARRSGLWLSACLTCCCRPPGR
jgi:hypothetical protein